MEVILKEDVLKLGRRGEVVKVADGYGRNFLLPRKLAIAASPANLRNIEQMRAAAQRKDAQDVGAAEAVAAQLGSVELTFHRRAGEKDVLFGSVTTMDVAHELETRGFKVDRRRIEIHEPIKTLGTFKVTIDLHYHVKAQVAVHVLREATDEADK